ncbi:MAG: hypothetical protein RLY87_2529 [Chloroflexota bacterium]
MLLNAQKRVQKNRHSLVKGRGRMNHPRCHPAFAIADALFDAATCVGYICCRDNGGRLRRVLHRLCRSFRCSKAHSHLATPPTLHQLSALWGVVMRGYSSSSSQYPHDSGLRMGCQINPTARVYPHRPTACRGSMGMGINLSTHPVGGFLGPFGDFGEIYVF